MHQKKTGLYNLFLKITFALPQKIIGLFLEVIFYKLHTLVFLQQFAFIDLLRRLKPIFFFKKTILKPNLASYLVTLKYVIN